MQSDVRAVLQYVPSFRGKVFVLLLDAARMTELSLAEALLDLIALQQVGVRLILISTGSGEAQVAGLLTDGELKWQATALDLEEVSAVLDRGQLALIERPGLSIMEDELVEFTIGISAAKLIAMVPEQHPGGNFLSIDDALAWKGEGAELLNRAGMVCERGIPRVHLLNENHQGVLMDELFSNEGVGVMVYADDYLSIREIVPDDISELLAMVGRSMRDAHLVPRSYEEIETNLDDFQVLTIDGNVVGCVALHASADLSCAEVACLYVKHHHGGLGYGALLVGAAERKARALGIPWVFALSNRAVDYFTDSLGYEQCLLEVIPETRKARLRESGRASLVIRKFLKA